MALNDAIDSLPASPNLATLMAFDLVSVRHSAARPETCFFQVATEALRCLISNHEINENVVRSKTGPYTWGLPNSDLTMELSYLGSGLFSFVWKVSLLDKTN